MRRARLIINPAAGAGRTARRWPDVVRALQRAEIDPDFAVTERPGHATELAAGIGDDIDLVLAVGGDGTAHEVINGLAQLQQPPPFGVIATGTACDLAHTFGAPSGIEEQVAAIAFAPQRELDLGWCTFQTELGEARRASILNVGAGFTARVAERAPKLKRLGPVAAYFGSSAIEWARNETQEAKVELDGQAESLDVLAFVVQNMPWAGGLLAAPGADPGDGQWDTLIIEAQPRWSSLNLLLRVYQGGHLGRRGVRYAPSRDVRFQPTQPQPVMEDGELVGSTPLEFHVEAQALPVLATEVRKR